MKIRFSGSPHRLTRATPGTRLSSLRSVLTYHSSSDSLNPSLVIASRNPKTYPKSSPMSGRLAPGGNESSTSRTLLRRLSQTCGSRSDQYSSLMSTLMIDSPARELE
jgi:hypothetical protein